MDSTPLHRLTRSGIKACKMVTRDAGFENETNDCFVKAVQAATGVPYRDAHAWVALKFARQRRKGTHCVEIEMLKIDRNRETIFGYRAFHRLSQVSTRRTNYGTFKPTYATLTRFVATHPTGRFIVWSVDHAFAVIDGTVYDNGAAGPRVQVTGIYELKASSQCKDYEGGLVKVAL